MELRVLREADWDAVASLITRSTNAWYTGHGMGEIFTAPEAEQRLTAAREAKIAGREPIRMRSMRKASR